jgi:hypothetical protein
MAQDRGRPRKRTVAKDAMVEALTDLVVGAREAVSPGSKPAGKKARKLEKRLAAARSIEAKRVRQLVAAQGAKGRKQVAKRTKQVGEAARRVATLAGKMASLAASAAGTAASTTGGVARAVGTAAIQAAEAVSPIKGPSTTARRSARPKPGTTARRRSPATKRAASKVPPAPRATGTKASIAKGGPAGGSTNARPRPSATRSSAAKAGAVTKAGAATKPAASATKPAASAAKPAAAAAKRVGAAKATARAKPAAGARSATPRKPATPRKSAAGRTGAARRAVPRSSGPADSVSGDAPA